METKPELTANDRALAAWIRKRLANRGMLPDLLEKISDEELLARYNEHKIESIKTSNSSRW